MKGEKHLCFCSRATSTFGIDLQSGEEDIAFGSY